MSSNQILLLGAIAGFTIFLGLPVQAGCRQPSRFQATVFVAAIATGIPRLSALGRAHGRDRAGRGGVDGGVRRPHRPAGRRSSATGPLFTTLFRRSGDEPRLLRPDRLADGEPRIRSLGAASAVEYERVTAGKAVLRADARASGSRHGIGLHNFSEGLAIGQSAASGRDQPCAHARWIGFGLHNAHGGFGIVGPFSAENEQPNVGLSSRLLGLIGGGPTFIGTLIGQPLDSQRSLSIALPWPSLPARSCT